MTATGPQPTDQASCYAFLRHTVYEQSAMVLDPARDYLFESRLEQLLTGRGLPGLHALVEELRARPSASLAREVAQAMTVNETSFFRDHSAFDLIDRKLLPQLLERRKEQRRLRLWSAACSTGQEPYSLAMLVRERLPQNARWDTEILGTDLSARVLARAEAGCYSRMEVNRGLPARLLLRYFHQQQEEWVVSPGLRSICRFEQRNLCAPVLLPSSGPAHRYDAILLRNVMLYFGEETRRRLLTQMHTLLAPDGFLVLGATEQAEMPHLWQPVLESRTCYYRPL